MTDSEKPVILNPEAVEDAPYTMKEQDKNVKKLKPTVKSYQNSSFLSSHEARTIRILCEFQEPAQRLNKYRVKGTVLFFGSARAMRREDYVKTFETIQAQRDASNCATERRALDEKLAGFRRVEWMCEWVDKSEELARYITQWAMTSVSLRHVMSQCPDYLDVCTIDPEEENLQPLVVTTGGGPGIMEAANKGAASVPGAKTMGMGISLPFEKGLNPYVSDGLEFEFHYFFTRKFWMMYSARALIIAPGGFGTMDELFELMTLRQTKKIPDLPIVLFCSKFWKTVINWQALADFGTVSQKEIDSLCFADTPQEAFEFVRHYFTKIETPSFIPPSPQAGPRFSDANDVSPMKAK